MIHFPILRWGTPYQSLDLDEVVHFDTGEPIAKVSQANPGLVSRDMRKAGRAREVLREIPGAELMAMVKKGAELFSTAELPLGDGTQTPDEFVRHQSATTGLPEHMCRMNMEKLRFVLDHLDEILISLTRRLDPDILSRGYGEEDGVMRSYQATTPVLGMVLPSNSPGVHSLWLPIIPLQIGLVLKPGPQEPWTPWRMVQAFFEAGIPRESVSLYPGLGDVGAAVLNHCPRSLIFGGTATVDQYAGHPGVQVHGPGFSKILIGEDEVDNWSSISISWLTACWSTAVAAVSTVRVSGRLDIPRRSRRLWRNDSVRSRLCPLKTRTRHWRRSRYRARPKRSRPTSTAS